MLARKTILCAMLLVAPAFATTLLNNGGFESGDARRWLRFSETGDISIGAPAVSGAHESEYAARLDAGETFYAQLMPAMEGEVFYASAYMLSEMALDPEDDGSSFRSIKLAFFDRGLNELVPASVGAGRPGPDPTYPGIEGLPLLDSTLKAQTWHLTEASGTAPEGTAQLALFIFNISQEPVWFDSVQLQRGTPGD